MMAIDVKKTICNFLKTTEFSHKALALLLANVRFIQEENMVEEMLFARPLMTDTEGEYISKLWIISSKKNIPICTIIACATCYGWLTSWVYFIFDKLPA